MREVSRHLFIPRRPLIASMLARPATIRVMHDGDVIYGEKVARDADRSLRAAGCAAAGNDDRKDRGVRTDFLFSVFADAFEDLSRVDLAGERLSDGRGNGSGH